MKKWNLINKILVGVWVMFAMTLAYAGAPLWTVKPLPLTATTLNISANGIATVKYQVTNQSRKSHLLVMTAIPGITQVTTAGDCPSPFNLAYQQSCTLTLQVNGSSLTGNVIGGPIVCQQGNTMQCYRPGPMHQLNITLTPKPPITAPGAPTRVTATAGNAQAAVSWTAPNDGGSPITSYTVTSTPAGGSCTVSGTTAHCTNLTNGTSYTFAAYATNALGNGPSVNSNAVTPRVPATVPGAPTGLAATARNTEVTVNWTAPSDGGSPITSYTVTPTPAGGACSVLGTKANCTGLTNGTSYTFAVYASNVLGNGPSANSNAVTPSMPATVPRVPTGIAATAGNTEATVNWTAPSDGGSPITSYTVTPTPADGACTISGATAHCTGLTNGTSYTFAIYASNALGNGPSANSNAVTPSVPATVPGAPTGVTATAGNTEAAVSWTAPSNGGSPITSYTVTSTPLGGSCAVSGGGTTAHCTDLTNSTSYTFAVYATNALGDGPSANSSPVTPTVNSYIVTPSGDGNETITPNSAQTVIYGTTQAFSVTAHTGYTLSTTVGGDCPTGSWSGNTYTTGAVTGNCSVSFSSSLEQFTVTASGDSHVTPSPITQQINYNETGTITLTVASGYTAAIASNSCGGTLSGNTFTTGAVTTNCSVSFSSSLEQFTVTASGDTNVTPSPITQQINYNATGTITLTVAPGYTAAIASNSCGGSLSGNTF
ncbi:MAG: fibronectin type III domain-containing protein, partial [Legionella sp.]|nr:fibronectin type III domain-containing protein [Legionella sp.]